MSDGIGDVQSAKAAVQSIMVADTGLSLSDLSTVFVKSGFFKDVREQSQAIVKVLVGQELGLKPLQSMMGIHIVEGKPELSAALLGVLVKRSGMYDYRLVEHTDTVCELEFFALARDGKREALGRSRFTMEDAARAGLAGRNTWKAYPRNMLHARALSNGVRWYAMDALGLAVYAEGELAPPERDNGPGPGVEVIDAVAEEVNPFASQQKEPVASGGVGGVVPADAPAPSGPGAAVPSEPKRGRPKKAAPEAVVEAVDPICPNVRPEDGARCTGPTGHEGACLYPVQEGEGAAAGPQEGGVVLGSEDCDVEGCWQGKGHPGPHVFAPQQEPPAPAPPSPADPSSAPAVHDVEIGATEFTLFGKFYRTAGMTSLQMAESYELATKVDKSALGKGYARGLLAKLMRVPVAEATRLNLTEEKAEQYLKALRQAAAAPAQADLP